MTVVAGFALLAVLIAAFVPPSMGADAVSGDECTLFVDWENYNLPEFDEEARAHQYFVAPHPLAQQPGNWQFVQVVWADGRQHAHLAGGWTLEYNEAHHSSCSPNQ